MLEELWKDTISNPWFGLALLIALAMVSGAVFRRLGFSKVVGQIALGIIIGPSLLKIITFEEGSETADIIPLLAPFGAIIMLFMIGLECDIKEIYTKKNIMIAIGGITLPWIAGYALAWLMLPEPSSPDMDRFSQSIFVGTALVATSVAITAGVLREMGIIGSSVAKTILGAAVVDDILGMVVLAITAGVATGTGLDMGDLFLIILAAVLFVGLGSFIGMRLAVRVIGRVERWGMARGMRESGFLLALSFAFIYAFISELIGISAIVGAFIAGTSFSACEYRKQFMEGITFLEWVFAPIFFLSLGILVDINIPAELWYFAVALAAVAMLSKLLGGGIPAWLAGMSRRDSVSVGLGMAARLEVAMIIALYGLTVDIIDTQIYSAIIIMGVISVLVAPSLLRVTVRHIGQSNGDALAPACEMPRDGQ
ncbi:MAG: cation:proton antiporter [Methanobacteriota archaeon]|nr:MAG: cation:proton antiporter [Euryarchaeota archaeon]